MAVIKKFRIKSFKDINSIIEFENVSLAYGNRLILDNISFKINEGVSFGMLGPNGVGKSTIFNLITGLINPSNGKIKISGEDVTHLPVYLRTKKFRVGYVPQYGGYFNDLTLIDNLKAIGEIIPSLKGKLGGIAMRVPTPNVYLIELVFCTKKNLSVEKIIL